MPSNEPFLVKFAKDPIIWQNEHITNNECGETSDTGKCERANGQRHRPRPTTTSTHVNRETTDDR